MECLKNQGITKENIQQNHEDYLQRLAFYKECGFDRLKARQAVVKHIDSPSSILEIGTGKGHLTVVLAELVNKVVTIDISEKDQHMAKLNSAYDNVLNKVEFVCANAEDLSFQDNSFALVVSAFSFHHFDNPLAVVREMIRVTADQLILTDFNDNGMRIIAHAHQQEGRVHEYNEDNDFSVIGSFLRKNGLAVEEYDDACQKIYVAVKQKNRGRQ